MRRPTATTVSAARVRQGERSGALAASAADASAFSAASLWTRRRGVSPRRGVSSIADGRTESGSTPIWASRARRRGEPDASTSRGRLTGADNDRPPQRAGAPVSLEAVGDAALGQIIGRHLDQDLVAGEYADSILAHLAGGMRDDLVVVFQFDAKGRVGEQFDYETRKFEQFFFRHGAPSSGAAQGLASEQAYLRASVFGSRPADRWMLCMRRSAHSRAERLRICSAFRETRERSSGAAGQAGKARRRTPGKRRRLRS